jgi:cation transport protein ChaC
MSHAHLTQPHRDPASLLQQTLKQWGGTSDLWVFGYASLIWRPEFESIERRPAMVYGWHRALEMRSRINRGTPERPGLVFALVSGGSCRGMVYREMPTGVYDPKWLPCHTPLGRVKALGFALSRRSPSHIGTLPDAQMLDTLRSATGRYGRTLDYLLETAECLREHGIRDSGIERLVSLARRHGLVG